MDMIGPSDTQMGLQHLPIWSVGDQGPTAGLGQPELQTDFYVHSYFYMSIQLCTSTSASVHPCLCMCMCTNVFCIYVSMLPCAHASLFCTSKHLCIFRSVGLCYCVAVHQSTHTSMYLYTCVCAFVSVLVSLCICICVSMHLCVYGSVSLCI